MFSNNIANSELSNNIEHFTKLFVCSTLVVGYKDLAALVLDIEANSSKLCFSAPFVILLGYVSQILVPFKKGRTIWL
jgi:hypothetical protein